MKALSETGDDIRARSNASCPTRLAIVTTAAPPSPNGQARVLGLVLGARPARPLYMTDQMNIIEDNAGEYGRYQALSPPRFQITTPLLGRLLFRANQPISLMASVVRRSNEIAARVRQEPVDVIVGCSGNPFDLPASWLAARRLGLPFIAYLFDDPVFQWEGGIYRRLARWSERIWSRDAAAFVVPNEVLAEDIQARIPRAKIHIVRNPAELGASIGYGSDLAVPSGTQDRPIRIVYTGSVYSAQGSAFRNLVASLDQLKGRFVAEIFTAQPLTALQSHGLTSNHIVHRPHVSQKDAIDVQRDADILFLPLAFDSPIPEVIRSSAPAKLSEYLFSGRPILVHAPRGSFAAELFRKNDAGLVVDTPDPGALADALVQISSDLNLRDRIVRNSMRLAGEFHVERSRRAFQSVLDAVRT